MLSDEFLPVVSFLLLGRCTKNGVQVVGWLVHVQKHTAARIFTYLSGHDVEWVMDLLLDSQEELLGVPTGPPTSKTIRATLAVINSQGSEEGR